MVRGGLGQAVPGEGEGVGVNLQAQGWGQVGVEGAGRRGAGIHSALTLSDPFRRSDQARSDQV